jgi:hypothetical protein
LTLSLYPHTKSFGVRVYLKAKGLLKPGTIPGFSKEQSDSIGFFVVKVLLRFTFQ